MNKSALLPFFLLLFFTTQSISQVEYAVLENEEIFIYEKEEKATKSSKVYKINIRTKAKTITHIPSINNGLVPNCWKKQKDYFVFTSTYGYLPSYGKTLIDKCKIEQLDSLSLRRAYRHKLDSILPLFQRDTFLARGKLALDKIAKFGAIRNKPLFQWIMANSDGMNKKTFFETILVPLSYDIVPLEQNHFLLYLRNRKELTKWKFHFNQNERTDNNWQHILTYSSDSVKYMPASDPMFKLQMDQYHFTAVKDSSFFEGHYIVFIQENNEFLINTKDGAIYFLGLKKIEKIGALYNLKPGPEYWLSKQLIIEDRNKERIFVFGKVKKLNKNLPFPTIKELDASLKETELINQMLNE